MRSFIKEYLVSVESLHEGKQGKVFYTESDGLYCNGVHISPWLWYNFIGRCQFGEYVLFLLYAQGKPLNVLTDMDYHCLGTFGCYTMGSKELAKLSMLFTELIWE